MLDIVRVHFAGAAAPAAHGAAADAALPVPDAAAAVVVAAALLVEVKVHPLGRETVGEEGSQ